MDDLQMKLLISSIGSFVKKCLSKSRMIKGLDLDIPFKINGILRSTSRQCFNIYIFVSFGEA